MASLAPLPLPRPLRPPARRTRLAPLDAAWLRMERPDSPMVVTALLRLSGPLPRPALVALLEERLLRFERFRQRVVQADGAETWEEMPDFDAKAHVHEAPAGVAQREEALRAWVGELMGLKLPRTDPLWAVHRAEEADGATVLVFRVHHAIADGSALLSVLLNLTDEPPTVLAPRLPHGGSEGLVRQAALALRGTVALGRLVLRGRDRPTPFKGPLSGEKRVAWSAPIPLERLKAAARVAGATVNDVLVAALSGALYRYLLTHAPASRSHRTLRAVIPVDLRTGPTSEALGNQLGLVFLPLPLAASSALERMRAAKAGMDALKRTPEALVAFRILQLAGRIAQGLANLGIYVFGRKATVVLTNVAGPTRPLALAGRRIDELLFWVPQAGGLGLGLSIFSYAGGVRVGVMSDAARMEDPAALITLLDAELHELGVLTV